MINLKALALAGGVFWAACIFVFTFINIYSGYGSMWAALLVDIYPGYSLTPIGSLVGLVYGFFDAAIGLLILGWLYNKFNCTCQK